MVSYFMDMTIRAKGKPERSCVELLCLLDLV